MGARFAVEHSNLIGFCTTEGDAKAPRADQRTLINFLLSLAYGHNLISSSQGLSDDWTQQVRTAAEEQLDVVHRLLEHDEDADAETVKQVLNPLRPLFTGYELFALVLPEGRPDRDRESFAFFTEVAIGAQEAGLILMPEDMPTDGVAQFVDPFPALRQLAEYPVAPPWVLFWTMEGGACALRLPEARTFYRDALVPRLGRGRAQVDQVIRLVNRDRSRKRILHLSDIHIGLPEANRRRAWLKQHLSLFLPEIDRVVITGDLFDTPKRELRQSFDELRLDIERMTSKGLLVVPGNHDTRFKGNALGALGRSADQVIDLDWSRIEIDDDMRTIFLPFNSSESGNAARGHVSDEQRLRIAAELDALIARRPEVERYFKVALVHHHPIAYANQPTAFYERLLSPFGMGDRLIAFQNADRFLRWCRSRGVSLILHGHKHIPHLASHTRQGRRTTIVGCGSSVGAEGKPMCYDIVTLDPRTGEWSVSFFHDEHGDGSGFDLQNIAIRVV